MQKRILFLSIYVVIAAVMYALSGVLWLGVTLVGGYMMYCVFKARKIREGKGVFTILKGALIILVIFLAGISIRLFLFEIYAIPSSSMEAALIPGDVVWVDKLSYGPKLPESPFEVPWINVLFYLNSSARERMDVAWWNYRRLAGFAKVKKGDILVFTRFKDQNIPLIKRCIGLPGEQLTVRNGSVFNFKANAFSKTVLIPVKMTPYRLEGFKEKMDSLGIKFRIYGHSSERNKITYSARIPEMLVESLSFDPGLDSLYVPDPPSAIESGYLKGIDSLWNIYNFGPITVPKKGYTVKLNERNHALYSWTIHEFETKEIIQRNGKFLWGDEEITSYTFENDYYFMMGDNREDSQDSRYYAFVPEQNIIGKADIILFSSDYRGFKWERLLKRL